MKYTFSNCYNHYQVRFSIVQKFDSHHRFLASIGKKVAYHQSLYKATPEWQIC